MSWVLYILRSCCIRCQDHFSTAAQFRVNTWRNKTEFMKEQQIWPVSISGQLVLCHFLYSKHNLIPHKFIHKWPFLNSFFVVKMLVQSSANCLIPSSIQKIKRNGPKIEPSATPGLTNGWMVLMVRSPFNFMTLSAILWIVDITDLIEIG